MREMATLLAGKEATNDADASVPAAAARVGAELRAARLRLGWLLPDLANGLRIRLAYLEAIEDGRVTDLPGSAYAIGFVRTYAASLGLDADEVARRFRTEAIEVNRKTELAFPAPVPQRGVPAGAVILVGAVIAALAYGAWFRLSGDHGAPRAEAVLPVPAHLAPFAGPAAPPNTPSPQVASVMPDTPPAAAAPAVSAPSAASPLVAPAPALPSAPALTRAAAGDPVAATPAQPPAPATPGAPTQAAPAAAGTRIVVQATTDAWVQVRSRGGRVLLNRLLRGGDAWPVPDEPNLLLTTGNAGGTELLVDGQLAPSLGKSGAVRRDLPLDAAALAQTPGAPPAAPPAGSPASTPRPQPQ